MWKKQIRAEEAARSALIIPSRNISPQNGSINEEVSENESEASSGTARGSPSGIAGRALVRAAQGLRGAADILHGTVNGSRST
jgi:hypothetical protein